MSKFCIFCGGPPSDKNREHIVPQWLLKLTGDPGRSAYFGRDWLSQNLDERIYSWNAFTFPACSECNSEWSDLEGRVKDIVIGMLEGAAVSAGDLHNLLDWLDKVRTGLWLGMIYLNKNYRAIIPQFHIKERVQQKDRALFIFEYDDSDTGIVLSGCDTPIFHTTPSVCRIAINHLSFVTISSDFLLAERFGWPFATDRKFRDIDTDGFSATVVHASGKMTTPIMPFTPELEGRVLLQPIAHQYLRQTSPESFAEYYANSYVQNSSLDPSKAIGHIFVDNMAPVRYPPVPSDLWKPRVKHPRAVLDQVIGLWVAKMQRSLYLDVPDFSHFPEKDREARESEIRGVVAIQDLVIKHITDGGR